MNAKLYESVVRDDIDEVELLLENSSEEDRIRMLMHVMNDTLYFSFCETDLPSVEVTNAMLQCVIGLADYAEWTRAIHIATRYRNYDVVSALLVRGALGWRCEVYTSPDGTTFMCPIDIAKKNEDAKMIALFLSRAVPLGSFNMSSRFSRTTPIGVIKIDLAISSFVPNDDMMDAIDQNAYDRLLLFTSDRHNIGAYHMSRALDKKRWNVVRLLHIIIGQTVYLEDVYDEEFASASTLRVISLPTLQEITLYTMRMEKIREELSVIRASLKHLSIDKNWMNIESNPILYPIITDYINS